MVRRFLFACVLVASAAVACGDSGGPGGPSGLVAVSGGGQSGHINVALAQPLVVRATGAGGAAFPNATITWTVTSGNATLTPTSSQTDASGNASTTVTLGATAGAVVVSAATAGTTPVTFALTAIGPATLAVVSGSGQTGPVGGTMAESLRVSLTGTDGLPYAGGTVVWAVTAGAGTASPPQSVTGANGQATTLISPAAAGGLTITASSGTATPATFTGTGVPPCQYVRPYTLGDVVSGTLSTLDCGLNLGGSVYYYDFYNLVFAAQQSFTVTMSSAFDTWVDLLKPTGEVLGSNDDSLGATSNSYFEGIFAAGNYVIGASSYDPVTTGSYTVRSAVRPPTIAQCAVIWGTRPITVTDMIAQTDCDDTTGGTTFYSDRLVLALESGATLEVRMTSAAVDPSLYLYDVFGGVIVASNDDSSAGNPTAFLSYAVPADGLFFIDAGTAVAGQTGAYTLTVAGTTVAGAAGSGVAASAWRIPAAFGRGAVGKTPLQIRMPLRARLAAGEGGGPK